MVVRCLYIARGKNNVVFMQKCLILKVVKNLKGFKNYMINTCFKRSLTEKKKLLLEKIVKTNIFLYLFSVFC